MSFNFILICFLRSITRLSTVFVISANTVVCLRNFLCLQSRPNSPRSMLFISTDDLVTVLFYYINTYSSI